MLLSRILSRKFSIRHYQNYINGEWKSPIASEGLYEIKNPATNETVADLELSCSGCINEATEVAKNAFKDWSQVSVSNRMRYMLKYQQLIRDNMEWLAEGITEEQGKTLIGM